jgi:CubicO group peptidase (beta-lactamase class C family)
MRIFPLALCTLLAATSAAQTITRLDGSHVTAAEAEAFARRTLAENNVTGAQIAVLNHGHEVWSFAYGLAQKNADRPFDRDTTTWSASITKAVFAAYFMQLVQRGLFDLDKPIAQQFPQPLSAYPRYRQHTSALLADPRWQAITPRMLLAHTSGLPNFFSGEPGDGEVRLRFDPGTRFHYSTEGINMLGVLVEAKLGQPLDDLMQAALFHPLGMNRTGLVFHKDFAPDVADRFDANGKFLSQTRRDQPRAGGSMSSSTDDLARFLSALFANRIMSPATRRKMLSPQIAIPFEHEIQTGDKALAEAAEPKSVGLAYGLGWGLLTKTKFGPAFFKEGHGDGAETYMICFERSQSCMIIQTNSDNGEFAFRQLLEHILGDTVTPWEWECYTPTCIAASRANP